MSRPARIAPLVCIAALMAVASTPARADQDPLCGTTITQNLTLDHDIGYCRETQGPALTIGAPGITIDLNGHRVAGFAAAILNPGFDRVTIKDGVLNSDHDGIQLVGADRNTIRDVTAFATVGSAVHLRDSDHNLIVTSKLNGSPGGLRLLEGSDRNVVALDQIGAYGTGLAIGASSHNLVFANRLTGDNPALSIGSGQRNVAAFNTAAAYEDGIQVSSPATSTLLFANRASNSEDGIDVESASTRLFFNVADDNRDWGIEAVPGVFGIGNRASGNGQPAQCLNVPCR